MNSGDVPERLCPLPIRPGPAAGEPAGAYIRRLAIANHLRPSYLRRYIAGPPSYLGAIQPERLAVLSGRTVAVLERTLTGLAQRTRPAAPAPQPAPPPRRRVRAADKPALFAAIRADARDGCPIRTLATRYHLHRRMIRQALADPTPPPRKPPPPQAMSRLREPITAMLAAEPDLTARQVWERLVDNHNADISYDRVHYYVVRLRPANPARSTVSTTAAQARSTETTPAASQPRTTSPGKPGEANVSIKIARAGQAPAAGTFS